MLELPMLGYVSAGFPSPAEEELADTMSIDEWLIPNRQATVLFKVEGDSMIGAGLMHGDYVLADRSAALNAKNGDIVIAVIDGETTMKYLRKRGNRVWLEAANKKYPPLHPQNELRIVAVVTGALRKY